MKFNYEEKVVMNMARGQAGKKARGKFVTMFLRTN